jgi:hypothetical protein
MGEHSANPLILVACQRMDDTGGKSSVRQRQVFPSMNVADRAENVVRNTLVAGWELRSAAVFELLDVRNEKTGHSDAAA